MPIELANIQLDRVHKVDTLEHAALVHHQVPGLEGNLTQNLGRDSVRLQIEGIFYGKRAEDELATLRKAYKARKPVDFLADVVGQAYFSQVVLETFEVGQAAQAPGQFSYRLTIAEYVPIKKSVAQNKAAVNSAIARQADAMVAVASLPDALKLGSIPELTNPVEPLNTAINQVVTALDGIHEPLTGLGMVSTVPLVAEPTPSLEVEIPEPPALEWVQQPPTADLLAAGVPIENLLETASPAELLAMGASTLALQQAGVSEADLLAAGVSDQEIAAAALALTTLSTVEQSTWIVLSPEVAPPEALVGQLLEIRDSTGLVVKTVTLNGKGQAQIENLPLGKYALVFTQLEQRDWEIVAPAGLPWVTLEVATDASESFAGQPFEIRDHRDTLIATDQLNSQGKAQFNTLEIGDYRLVFTQLEESEWTIELPEGSSPQAEQMPLASWGIIALETEDIDRVANQPFELKDSSGAVVQSGVLDAQGKVVLERLVPGPYTLVLPQLEASNWRWNAAESLDSVPPTGDGSAPSLPWSAIAVETEDIDRVANQPFELKDSSGTIVQSGVLDAQGEVVLRGLEPETYTLVLPQIEASHWHWRVISEVDSRWSAIAFETDDLARLTQQVFEVRNRDGNIVAWGQIDIDGMAYVTGLNTGDYTIVFSQQWDRNWEIGMRDP